MEVFMKTNKDKLVVQSVQGKIVHPQFNGYRVTTDGMPLVLPATGGITYNIQVGDDAFGWVGDHVEPGVTIKNEQSAENAALNVFACIGNEAKVISGDAKGSMGYVSGSHGGVEHVMVAFPNEVLEQLTLDDKIMVKTYGQGFEIEGFEDVKVMSIDPHLFEKMAITIEENALVVPVAAVIPQHLMGSGVGAPYSQKGDYDLITSDRAQIAALGLDKLRFGDFVLLQDCDNTYGLGGTLPGAVSIGVVIHSDCIKNGHGPGISIVMSCKMPRIKGRLTADANLKNYMK
jgi:hypothetical protein